MGGCAGIVVNYTFKRTVLPHFRQIYSLTQHYLNSHVTYNSYLHHTFNIPQRVLNDL